MPFVEDIGQFLRVDEFAHACELILAGGAVRQVFGIFDEPFLDADLGEYRMDTSQPRLLGKASDFAGASRGDTLIVLAHAGQPARSFDVLSAPQIDGTGMATLRLAPQIGQGAR